MVITPGHIKHGSAIILLVLSYLAGTMGLFTSYYTNYHRQAFQSQIRQAPTAHLDKLSFSEQDFESIVWFDDRTEFEWEGRMYDVSEISQDKYGYTILCKNDTMEEMLLSLMDLTKSGQPGTGKKGNPQPQFFSHNPEPKRANLPIQSRQPLSSWHSFYLSIAPQIPSPPPRG